MAVDGPRWIAAALAPLLVFAFVRHGEWASFARIIPRTAEGYARPYRPEKYLAHAVWMMADAKLEGTLFAEYEKSGQALQVELQTVEMNEEMIRRLMELGYMTQDDLDEFRRKQADKESEEANDGK